MAFWDTVKRIGTGVATMGASEIGGGGLGDTAFGKVKTAQTGNSADYDYGGDPAYAKQFREYLQGRAYAAERQGAPQLDRSSVDNAMGGFNRALAGQSGALRDEHAARLQQQQALGMYRDAASGNAPSVAAAQQQQGLDEASRTGQNIAAGAIGANPLLAASNASAASADAARRSTTSAAMLRAQEIDAARAGFAGLSGQMRQGDLARGQSYLDRGQAALGAGQLGFGAEQAQAGLEMQQRQMSAQERQAYDQFQMQVNRDALAGRMGYGNSQAQVSMANAGNSAQRRGQNQQLFNDTLNSVGNLAGGMGGG